MLERAARFADELGRRRTVRDFADRPVPREIIEHCLRAAGSAPSGAHQQPWRFVAVQDGAIKARIRTAAEAEERARLYREAVSAWRAAAAEQAGIDRRHVEAVLLFPAADLALAV